MEFALWATSAVDTLTMGPGASAQPWVDLFAPGGTYADPLTAPTSDVAAVHALTRATFPDWAMTIVAAHGDEGGGVIEWVGGGHLGTAVRVTLHACSVVHLDAGGRVERWRDYFDMGEFSRQAGGTNS